MSTLHNLLEPAALIRHFCDHPPERFHAVAFDEVPAFATRFDLLTTLEPAARRRIEGAPFARAWTRLARPRTCFIGTTVSEYALLPGREGFVRDVVSRLVPRYPFVIIKDIPTEAVLAGDEGLACSRQVMEACRAAGFVLVDGQALAYVPIDFASTDDYLRRFSRARRRDLRRKLRSARSLEIEIIPTGDPRFAGAAFRAEMYAMYESVFEQSEIHFDRLTPEFFEAMLQDRAVGGVVFLYRSGGALIGWNFCVCNNGMLIDKYVGFAYPAAPEHNLYTVSWFENLQYALSHGLRCYVAGWTDPEIKRHLGARFTFTTHAVYVRNPIVRKILTLFKRSFESDRRWFDAHVPAAHS